MADWTLHLGNCLEVLPTLAGGSVQTCCTSPPYYGLRDYGCAGQIGLEPAPDCGERHPSRLQLRPDLTSDEVDYVLRELRESGLL